MPVIRKNQRDERRRRALVDDTKTSTEGDLPRKSSGRKTSPQNTYADAALACNQPRITDLIPTRIFSLWVILLAGLAVCCLNATAGLVYYARFQIRFPQVERLFQPSAPGSFVSWTASIVLLLATLFAVLTLWIRRHRIDDYRGRYRIWFFVPILLAVASIDAIVGITKISIVESAEIELGFATAKVSHLLICFLGIAVGVRLLLEIRPSKAGATLLVLAGSCYLFSFLVSWQAFEILSGLSEYVSAVTMLAGHWLLSVSLLAHLRYIFMDSQGEITALQAKRSQRKIQAKKDKEAAADAKAQAAESKKAAAAAAKEAKKAAALAAKEAKKSRPDEQAAPDVVPMKKAPVQEKQEKPTEPKRTPAKRKTTQSPSTVPAEKSEESMPNSGAMSRAERKRLRKEKKKNRRAA